MVYRAIITDIQNWVEDNYNTSAHNIIRDTHDSYIEVDDEDEAELLECINRKQTELLLLKSHWHYKYDNDK